MKCSAQYNRAFSPRVPASQYFFAVHIFSIIAFVGFLFAAPALLRAQSNPPFQSPSLDSNCYFPQIGNFAEMDTLYGSKNYQELGDPVAALGTKPNGNFGNMFIGNLTLSSSGFFGSNPLTQVATGQGFNLHQMIKYVQKLIPDDYNAILNGYRLGHYRDREHVDMFVNETWRIYWADDDGNYDSTRFTFLNANIRHGDFIETGGVGRNLIDPYTAHLTSDTIDDIIASAYSDYSNDKDTAYALIFRGGNNLYGKDTVFEDTSALLYPMTPNGLAFRACTQADFRGVGRDDLIVSDAQNNLCYYKNDPPFSIYKFAQAVTWDTILAEWQNPHLESTGAIKTWFTMRALPKARGDQSVDFMPIFPTVDYPNEVLFIFRGGPDFGSRRITLDSAAYAIRAPVGTDVGFGNWPLYPANAGDMTGTGNDVLLLEGRNDFGDAWYDNFYVTGKALDDKIDIYNSSRSPAVFGDTLTANSDSLEDFLVARPSFTGDSDLFYTSNRSEGTLWLYYGAKQIPVRLNPLWDDVKRIPTHNGAALSLSPNPAQSWSVATIVWPDAEEAEYEVYNILGNLMQSGNIRLLGGAEQQRIYFPNLASGVYEFVIHGESHGARAKLVIAR